MNKAYIFDMDGVLVDSEGFWSHAEREIFEELGVVLTEDKTALTKSMTAHEVIAFWYSVSPWKGVSFAEVEQKVIDRVIALIEQSDCVIPGVKAFIQGLHTQGFKLGLATNSPYRVIPVVLEKTSTKDFFDVISSAEFELKGKPEPDIYINTAKKLEIKPEDCIVIEDSYYGMKAAKSAGMKVLAFTNGNVNLQFDLADGYIYSFANSLVSQ